MPITLTHRDIEDAHRYARDAMNGLRGVGAKDGALSRTTKNLAKLCAVAAGAGVAGLASGYYGSADFQIGDKKIPIDGLLGLAGLGASVFMEDGMASETLSNFSSGVFAAFATKFAIGYGRSFAEKKDPPALSAPAPLRMIEGGAAKATAAPAPLTLNELTNLAQAAAR